MPLLDSFVSALTTTPQRDVIFNALRDNDIINSFKIFISNHLIITKGFVLVLIFLIFLLHPSFLIIQLTLLYIDRHVLLATRLILSKITDELRTYPNSSKEAFISQITQSKTNYQTLLSAAEAQVITNSTVQKINWIDGDTISTFSSIPTNINTLHSTINALLAALPASNEFLEGKHVKFFISPVQPSILYLAHRLRSKCCGNLVIRDEAHTGPENIKNAIECIQYRNSSVNDFIIFVAPLSAYALFDKSTQISEYFDAVAVILAEPQHILVVNDGNRMPLRRGKLLYYNNSTAEECWAQLTYETRSMLERTPVDDYEDYLKLLNGKASQKQLILSPGDAIITWPPLTKFFDGRPLKASHFVGSNAFDEHKESYSRIVLFMEKRRDCDKALMDFADKFARALILMMYQQKLATEKFHIFHIKERIAQWMFVNSYMSLFKGILGIN